MEELKNLIKSKTQHLIWEFIEEKVDDNYYHLTSKANLGTLTVSWERYVNKDDQTDLVANLIIM